MGTSQQDRDAVEIWECTTEGSVWVAVKDPREGGWTSRRVGGKSGASRRIQITRDERLYNQELCLDELSHLDPFTNGQLICTNGRPAGERTRYELTDVDLQAILDIDDEDIFTEAVNALEIELPLRRLLSLAERTSTIARHRIIADLVEARYRVGGTQGVVADMIAAGEHIGRTLT